VLGCCISRISGAFLELIRSRGWRARKIRPKVIRKPAASAMPASAHMARLSTRSWTSRVRTDAPNFLRRSERSAARVERAAAAPGGRCPRRRGDSHADRSSGASKFSAKTGFVEKEAGCEHIYVEPMSGAMTDPDRPALLEALQQARSGAALIIRG